jgi:N-acetylglutamate synthase-like GNAT family acetyltransferase
MPELEYRTMSPDELPKLADIDRSERVYIKYTFQKGKLTSEKVDWQVPSFFPEREGEHSLAEQIAFCKRHVQAGAILFGAFEDENLAAVAVLTPEVRPSMSHLAYLHVSHKYRRQGIASHLLQEMVKVARQGGASKMYVSATPSGSAVGFYLHHGFTPTTEPIPELLALEPEDIHMIKEL